MASLRIKPNSKFWVACFNLPGGLRVQRSTKTTDRKLATKLADQYEEAGRAGNVEIQARKILADIHKRVTGRTLPAVSIGAYLTQWLEARRGTVAPSTAEVYGAIVREFLLWLGPRANADLPLVRSADFAAFRDHMGSQLSPRTANLKLKVLKIAMEQAWRDGFIEANPATRVQTLKLPARSSERKPFRLEEIQRLLDVASGEWKGLILFGLYTGQRLGDLARLCWSAVDAQTATLSLTTQKTKRRQILPLANPLLRWLGDRERGSGPQPLFPAAFQTVEKTGRVSGLSNQFQTILANAGLAEKRSHRKAGSGRAAARTKSELSFHSLRHSVTSLMKNAGVSPAIVQEFVGHESRIISQNYTHIEMEALRKAAEALPDLT